MIKYIALIFNIIGIFLISVFTGDIDVEIKIPAEVSAGSDFTVELTINKGELEGFARFQQELPVGFTATPISVANGDWVGDNNKIKIIWFNLTSQEQMNITYNIHVDSTVTGIQELCGEFSYIFNEERKTAKAGCKQIMITPSNFAENTDSTNKPITPDINSTLSCIRKRTASTTSDKEFIVELLINKKDLGKDEFAKIQENLPPGYTAEGIETQGGIFTFKNQKAKFLWMTLPQEDEFIVSYKILSTTGIDIGSVALNGTFSYIEDGNTKSIYISEQDFDSQLADNNKDENDGKDTTQDGPGLTGIPEPAKNITYSVQICALKKYRNPSYFNGNKYNLPDKVNAETHEGWNKYTIGSFYEYKEARDYRIKIWEQTIVDDAFVSAYNNGTRITVQEALMIANQKWYQ